jgi:hypothetical protein
VPPHPKEIKDLIGNPSCHPRQFPLLLRHGGDGALAVMGTGTGTTTVTAARGPHSTVGHCRWYVVPFVSVQLQSMPVAAMSFYALTAFACVSTQFDIICLFLCCTQQAYPLYESTSTIQLHCFHGCWLEPSGLAIASTTTTPRWISCLALTTPCVS